MKGQDFIDFSFTDTDGVTHSLSERLDADYNILLEFFYADCPPCVLSGAELEAIHQDYVGKNVEVWSISPYDSTAVINAFKDEHGFSYVTGGLEGGGWDIFEIYADSFNLEFFPTVSIICRDGSINWDIWPYTPGGAPEWRGALEDCGVYDVVNTSTGTDEITAQTAVSLAPNPVQDVLNLNYYRTDRDELTAEIYDFTGRRVDTHRLPVENFGQQSAQISVRDLPPGTYFLRLLTAGKSGAAFKFSVQ